MDRIALDTRTGRVCVLARPTAGRQQAGRWRLITLDAVSGARVRIVSLPPNQGYVGYVTVDEATRRVFVAAPASPRQRGYIAVLDSLSGRLLRVVPVSADGGWSPMHGRGGLSASASTG